ncbi:FIST N-terminal domain-containing protein [Pacificoceanicola onchidii]|uniref:FIST N-terminal domain-containing protein n=1 Tax=Pacificoceanicola onchidii TaxID=2562685 RepID=UPI0010A68C1A|nr:FIST N-terminal domain-containing protein [Pacificoceanicola onchidii]
MDGATKRSARGEIGAKSALRVAQASCTGPDRAGTLATRLGPGPFALVCLFVSPDADFAGLTRNSHRAFGGADVLACTTAGEIGQDGYEEGQIIAIGFPCSHFATSTLVIDALDELDEQAVIDRLIQDRMALNQRAPEMQSEFAFLMVDGLSLQEEHLTGVLTAGLGPTPLFGGSAGDGEDFRSTFLSRNGSIRQNAALLALVRSRCPVQVFSLDHMVPGETRMVVTKADPDRRVVQEINAEPAAQEYARLLGKDPNQLSAFTFAAHPVVVRLGDTHHVRSIQRMDENGDLVFFSAIDEGMVLSLADHRDIAEHLDERLSALGAVGKPDHILACDCLLRKIEATQHQRSRQVSDILTRNNVVGFSTYGEQIGALHVNQTLTGVAFYPAMEDV